MATLVGADAPVAGRLALSMLGVQIAIGAVNDWADAPRDAVAKRGKPIPSGLASTGEAMALGMTAAVIGIGLSGLSGAAVAAVAGLGLALGVAYDIRLSTSRWSWLPLALALPLVPVHAWLGATGGVPGALLPLLPAGVLAGAALALANGIVDLERDARTSRRAAVVALGAGRAWVLHVALLVPVAVAAVWFAPAVSPASQSAIASAGPVSLEALAWLRTWGVALGSGALLAGAAALRLARPALRERGWELEAIGIAAIGLGWLAGVAASSGGLEA